MPNENSSSKNGFGSSGGRSTAAVSGMGVSSVPCVKALMASQKNEQLQAIVSGGSGAGRCRRTPGSRQ
jgi:hypothetical protein